MQEKQFLFECWGCGSLVPRVIENPINRTWCPDCQEKHDRQIEKMRTAYMKLRSMLMFDRALRKLEKQEAKLCFYKESAEVVADKIKENSDFFQSSQEIMAAMELLRNRIRIKLQQNIAGHKVDMLLPDEKIVLEIDGYMHDHSQKRDYRIDIKVRAELGSDWEVVRIPVKYIEQNISQLLNAIREIKRFKQETRKKNKGILPAWFSRREAEAWKAIEGIITV